MRSSDYPITQAARDAYRLAANRQFRRFLDVSAENAELRAELDHVRAEDWAHDTAVFADLSDERDKLKAKLDTALEDLARARQDLRSRAPEAVAAGPTAILPLVAALERDRRVAGTDTWPARHAALVMAIEFALGQKKQPTEPDATDALRHVLRPVDAGPNP